MRARPLLRAFALSLSLAGAAHAVAAPGTTGTTDWAAIARQDLGFAADTIRSRHAGHVAGQPSVTQPLAAGMRGGVTEADGVRSEQDYLRLMMRFIAGFGDPHTGIDLHLKVRGWTGLVIDQDRAAKGGRYRVLWSEPGWPTPLPPSGSVVRSCDGTWIGTWLQLQVAPFMNRSVEYGATFSTLAQQVMFDLGLGWTPSQCLFELPDGSRRSFALPLRGVPGEVAQARLDALQPRWRAIARPVGLSTLAPDKRWVGMPDFNGARSAAAYEALYPKLAALPKSGWVVFDLRGNGGGDSTWGSRALAALYGEAYARQLSSMGDASKYLIADAATASLLKRYIAAPEYAASKAESEDELAKVEAAMRAGERMALVAGEAGAAPAPAVLRRPHGPRVAAVIDRGCFSSCMAFLQQLQAMGDTVVLGESTLGYSPFGEIKLFELPSGHGVLRIPLAIYRTARETREPFVPDYPFGGNMADDDALQKWVEATLNGVKQ
ncbi:S41 family peptidase [Massilia sp. LXY-6]|uniref:S41 family peptidase n=1 Tax=Massilia sp. LXY-6 TaxID=3379823 RepID=UPI003EDF38EA